MQRRKSKVPCKLAADPHREYLNAESDDESEGKVGHADEYEDLGEAPGNELAEVSKHIYEIDELEKLVTYVKDMTTIARLKDGDWTEDCCDVIREYFSDLKRSTLTIFLDHYNDRLICDLDFPAYPKKNFFYFVKEVGEVVSIENVDDKITFGAFNDHLEAIVLNSMENIFSPILSHAKSWSDTKANFLKSMEDNMCKITDLRYKMLGLTVIYQPADVNGLTLEEATADKELIKRLEGTVLHWTKQIELALDDREQITSTNKYPCLMDEYQFWIHRHNNLRDIDQQLHSPIVKHVINILASTQSPNVRRLMSLSSEIKQSATESETNIVFMRLLKKPCDELDACTDPDDIQLCVAKIIHTLKIIWSNAPFYNNLKKVIYLNNLLNNQIILIIRQICNIDEGVDKLTPEDVEKLRRCVQVCLNYKNFYVEKTSEIRRLSLVTSLGIEWNLDQMFSTMEPFIKQCQEILEKFDN